MLTQARLELLAHVLAASPDGNLLEFALLLDKIFSAGIMGMGKTVAFSRQMLDSNRNALNRM